MSNRGRRVQYNDVWHVKHREEVRKSRAKPQNQRRRRIDSLERLYQDLERRVLTVESRIFS
jgi:hypothetical protein